MPVLKVFARITVVLAALAVPAIAQTMSDADVAVAIKAGVDKKFSNLVSDCLATSGFGEGFAANLAGGLQFDNGFDVAVSRGAGRIAAMAAEAKRLYKPFAVSDVPDGIRSGENAYVVVVPAAPRNSTNPTKVSVSSLIERVVLKSKSVESAVVQPIDFASEPVSWGNLMGATVEGNRAYATFSTASIRELPPGDFDVVVITKHGERRCKVGQKDRQRLFPTK